MWCSVLKQWDFTVPFFLTHQEFLSRRQMFGMPEIFHSQTADTSRIRNVQ